MKTRMCLCSILLFVFFLEIIIASPVNAVIRIMPLGDSITVGSSSGELDPNYQVSYRKALWDLLVADGYDVDFVGSRDHGSAVFGDSEHEGHSGWTADEIRDGVYNWLNNNPADIILLHIGTNDINSSQDPTDIPLEISQILDEIDQYESDYSVDITVILALIINRLNYICGNPSTTTTFNDDIYGMAQDRINSGDRIEIIDMECGADIDYREEPTGDMWDSLHPVETGYEKMADVWFYDGLKAILPVPDPLTCTLDSRFQETTLYNGMEYYTDRTYTVTSVPGAYLGMDLTFELFSDVTVYVAYDSRATSLPNWMSGFTYTGNNIYTSLSTQPHLKVYSKSYFEGDCVNFGANKAPGFSGTLPILSGLVGVVGIRKKLRN